MSVSKTMGSVATGLVAASLLVLSPDKTAQAQTNAPTSAAATVERTNGTYKHVVVEMGNPYEVKWIMADALKKSNGRTMASNLDMDKGIQSETLYVAPLARTGTFLVYEAPGKAFGEQVNFEGLIFDVPKEYQGRKDCALVLEQPDVDFHPAAIAVPAIPGFEDHPDVTMLDLSKGHLTGKVIKVIENFPETSGWYDADKETGIPQGPELPDLPNFAGYPPRHNEGALHLVRNDSGPWIGAVVRGVNRGWNNAYAWGTDVFASGKPDDPEGVAWLVESQAEPESKDMLRK